MILADQLVRAETGKLDEGIVTVGDDALEIGLRHQILTTGERLLALSHGLIVFHGLFSGGSGCIDNSSFLKKVANFLS
jgi:hypothetical protein